MDKITLRKSQFYKYRSLLKTDCGVVTIQVCNSKTIMILAPYDDSQVS